MQQPQPKWNRILYKPNKWPKINNRRLQRSPHKLEPKIKPKTYKQKGKSLFKIMTENNTVNSPGQTTRTDPRNAKETKLDLILASPILSHLQIDTGPSLGSDHVTVIIRNNTTKKIPSIKRKKKERMKDNEVH